MLKGYKFEILPSDCQKELIHKTIGCNRLVYNLCLDHKIKVYKKKGKYVAYDKRNARRCRNHEEKIKKLRMKSNKDKNKEIRRLKKRYFERYLKKCPICGRTRRNGYIQCCKNCMWVIEKRKFLSYNIERTSLNLESIGYNIYCHFYLYDVAITLSRCFPRKIKQKDANSYSIYFESCSSGKYTNIKEINESTFNNIISILKEKVDNFINKDYEYNQIIKEFPLLEHYTFNYNQINEPFVIRRIPNGND